MICLFCHTKKSLIQSTCQDIFGILPLPYSLPDYATIRLHHTISFLLLAACLFLLLMLLLEKAKTRHCKYKSLHTSASEFVLLPSIQFSSGKNRLHVVKTCDLIFSWKLSQKIKLEASTRLSIIYICMFEISSKHNWKYLQSRLWCLKKCPSLYNIAQHKYILSPCMHLLFSSSYST